MRRLALGAPRTSRLAVAAVLTLAGCAASDGAGDWTITVDTLPNGAPRVVNAPPAEGIRPRWVLEADLTIGSVEAEGPELFGQVRGIAALPDGRIAVLDAQAQELRVFASDGTHLRTFGGQGEGPGELAAANGILAGDDGLIRVHDPRNARISLFHPDSGFVSSERLEVQGFGFLWDAAIDSIGRVYERALVGWEEDRWRVVRIFDPRGVWTDTVRLSRYEYRVGDPDPPGFYRFERGMSTVPFWPTAASVIDPRGFFWVKGAGNEYRIAQTTFTGDTVLMLESRRAPLPVSAAERDSAIERMREVAGEELDWSQIPAEKPVVQGLTLDHEGRLWVRVLAADTLVTFDVFGRDGRYEGTAVTTLPIPSYWDPSIRSDRMHALVTGELDVPFVVRARLREIDD